MKSKVLRPIIVHWEPISGAIHVFAAFAALVGLNYLDFSSSRFGTDLHCWANAVFMDSMLILYTASAVYHVVPHSDEVKPIFRSIDQTAIFCLIAGTYTPLCLIVLKNSDGLFWLKFMWAMAALGSLIAILQMIAVLLDIPRLQFHKAIPAVIGLTMGWAGAYKLPVIHEVLGERGYNLFLAGGLIYTAGAILYLVEYRRDPEGQGYYHEIFHLLVMAGSLCHYWLMLFYVMPLR